MLTLLAATQTYYQPTGAEITNLLVFIVLLLIALTAYILPSAIAQKRRHPNATPITVVNLFLGWTFLGWVVALAWSLTAIPKEPKEVP